MPTQESFSWKSVNQIEEAILQKRIDRYHSDLKEVKKKFEQIPQDELPQLNVEVSTIQLIYYWIIENIKTSFLTQIEGKRMEQTTIEKLLTGFLTRLILKVGSGVLLTLGVTESSLIPIVGALIAIAWGWIASKFNYDKALNTTPPAPTK